MQRYFTSSRRSPNTDWLPASIARDDRGFITIGANIETSLPGVFAGGDLRAGSTMQATSAVGEGATAALMIRDYLKRHRSSDENPSAGMTGRVAVGTGTMRPHPRPFRAEAH